MTIHFICRGNAFRSILAEAYLNSLHVPGVQVISSGTRAAADRVANTENFQRTLAALRKHGLDKFAKDTYGDQLTEALLRGNDVVIFLSKAARNEYRGPETALPPKTMVWDVPDLGEEGSLPFASAGDGPFREATLRAIEPQVDALVRDVLAPR